MKRSIIGNLTIKSLANKFDQLKEIVRKYVDSLANKFDQLKGIVLKYVDILMITQIKFDSTFPDKWFLVEKLSVPFCLKKE